MPIGGALVCLVIGVSDGDTLTARCDSESGQVNLNIRVAEIDAPEKSQPFGDRSRQRLASLLPKASPASRRNAERHIEFVVGDELPGQGFL